MRRRRTASDIAAFIAQLPSDDSGSDIASSDSDKVSDISHTVPQAKSRVFSKTAQSIHLLLVSYCSYKYFTNPQTKIIDPQFSYDLTDIQYRSPIISHFSKINKIDFLENDSMKYFFE